RAGQSAAVLAAGEMAALIAPLGSRQSMFRRITDGRGPLRVFARARADLLSERQERLRSVERARLHGKPNGEALSSAGEHTVLLAAVDAEHALVAVEERRAVLAPVARNEPMLLLGEEHLELRSTDQVRRLFS